MCVCLCQFVDINISTEIAAKSNIASPESHFLPELWLQVTRTYTHTRTHTHFVTHLFVFHTDTVRRHTFPPHTLIGPYVSVSGGVDVQYNRVSPSRGNCSSLISLSSLYFLFSRVTLIYYCTSLSFFLLMSSSSILFILSGLCCTFPHLFSFWPLFLSKPDPNEGEGCVFCNRLACIYVFIGFAVCCLWEDGSELLCEFLCS